jgi:RNA polymerase sigma-70 factor, ECF subfamily
MDLTSDLPALRRLMFAIAYRMLGSVAEAEDIVQEAFLRLHRAQQDGTIVESPKAYATAVTTRLAIDHLRSARVRRETYVGEWLPEPVVGGEDEYRDPQAARQLELADSLSMAFLLVLETLSPVERAVFLLREVFDYDYGEIAAIVGKSEQNCRQILARARRHVDARRPRFDASREQRETLSARFFDACRAGDLDALVQLLAADAAFYGDGGGKATAILNPVHGGERVARLMRGIFAQIQEAAGQLRLVEVNGQPGILVLDAQGRLGVVMTIDIAGGVIRCVRSIVNPDKLQHLGPLSELTQLPPKAPRRESEPPPV